MVRPVLEKKTILITGGTGRLGSAFVRRALSQGAQVYLTYVKNKAEALALEELGAHCFLLDLNQPDQIKSFASRLVQKKIPLDAVIHNAAAVRDHVLWNMSELDWDEVMNVNLKAPYLLTKELLPILLKKNQDSPDGRKIFFITSRTAVRGGFGVSNYSASKAGLLGLMKSLAMELGKKKILVNAVNPGFMESEMTRKMPQEAVQANLEASPLRQYSNPDEVADFLIYLCSSAVKGVTGQTFHFESRGCQ